MMRKIEKKENVFGGNGPVFMEHLLDQEQLGGMCRLFNKVTLKPGSSLGYHVHEGDSEAYYILSGEGTYNNNGETMKVVPGDVTFTKNGEGHGISNDGTEPLIMIALVINEEKRI